MKNSRVICGLLRRVCPVRCETGIARRAVSAAVSVASSSSENGGSAALLRRALVSRLCCSSSPLPRKQVYWNLVNPSRLVEEFSHNRETRRHARLRSALRFLRRHNVLMHSLLFYVPQSNRWNVTGEFDRLVLYGESILTSEVRMRLLRLFPSMSSDDFALCCDQILAEESLVALFDALEMNSLVGSKPSPAQEQSAERLTAEHKRSMLLAVIGEMKWFAARTKATDRTHNNAIFPPSDVLIMHVLCTHLLESLPAEAIYRHLSPHLQALRAVWVNEPMSLPSQLRLVPRTIGALSLSAERHSCSPDELSHRSVPPSRSVVGAAPLTADSNADYIVSTMRPSCNHRHFCPDWYGMEGAVRTRSASLSATPQVQSPTNSVDSPRWMDERRQELLRQMDDGAEKQEA